MMDNAEHRGTRDPIERAIKAAAARYVGLHLRFLWYARLKYRMDPCYRAIARHIGAGSFTVDLGTGLGMLPVLLGELGGRRRALGVEWDRDKVRCGVHASRGLPGVEIVEGDLQAFTLPACDVITFWLTCSTITRHIGKRRFSDDAGRRSDRAAA